MVLEANPILVRTYRGEKLESVHRGRYVLVGTAGVLDSRGDIEAETLPRSSLKPLQLLPLFASGEVLRLGFTAAEACVLMASHSGDEQHVATVQSLQKKAGLREEDLGCGAHAPMDVEAAIRLYEKEERPRPVHNNCSGKHSGMLLRTRMLGGELSKYLDPTSPVQAEIRELLALLCDLDASKLEAVIDGCGAPMYAIPLIKHAALFRDLANPKRLPQMYRKGAQAIFNAQQEAPHFLAGRGRFDTALLEAAPGTFLCKCGAEGFFGIGVRASKEHEAMGLAIKMDDGAARGYETFLPQYLYERTLLARDSAGMAPFFAAQVRNTQGLVVGRMEALV